MITLERTIITRRPARVPAPVIAPTPVCIPAPVVRARRETPLPGRNDSASTRGPSLTWITWCTVSLASCAILACLACLALRWAPACGMCAIVSGPLVVWAGAMVAHETEEKWEWPQRFVRPNE